MNRSSLLCGAAAAALIFSALDTGTAEAIYYPPPEELGVSVGSTEIDKSEINGDTVLEIPVYVHNNPGFTALRVIVDLDSRLGFDADHRVSTDIDGIAGISVSECGRSNTLCMCFETSDGRFLSDGELGRLRIRLNGDIQAGSYDISLPESYGDSYIFIDTYSKQSARFGGEYFKSLEGGSITVTDSSAAPVQEIAPAAEDTAVQESTDVEPATEPASVTEVTTVPASSASSAPKVKVTQTVVQKLYESPEKDAAEEPEADEEPEQAAGKEEKHNNLLVPAIIAVLLEIGTAVVLIFRRGGRSK